MSTFFNYPAEIRRIIYTTNAIEGYNRQLRKVTKNKGVFPTEKSIRKLFFLAHSDIAKSLFEYSGSELQLTKFPEPIWTIPAFLPTGLVFLAGKPKVGKSWLALQLANAVGNGSELFGQSVVRKHVLYLALEDSFRRVQKRTLLQGFPKGQRTIKFMTEFPSLTHPHAFSLLRRVIEESNFQFVIINTISKLLGDLDQNEGGTMNLIFSRLHSLSQDQMITILLVAHHRKGYATHADPIEDLLGSRAKSAVADCLVGLYRARNNG